LREDDPCAYLPIVDGRIAFALLRGYNIPMTTKATTVNGLSKPDAKYRTLINDCLREFKELQKDIRRQRAKTVRLRASSRGTMKDTWEVLRRVEATL